MKINIQADSKLRQAVAVLPWGHNLLLINKVQSLKAVSYYANEVVTKGWSRDWLLNAIKMDSYRFNQKQIKSHNFRETLPAIDIDSNFRDVIVTSFSNRYNQS